MRKIKWTIERLSEESKKFSSRWDFQKGNGSAYKAAVKLGVMNELCKHMTPKYTYWTDEMVADEAKKFTARKQFSLGSPKAYDAASKRGILDDVCKHMMVKHKSWSTDMLFEEAKKYKNRWDFQNNSKDAYMVAWSRGVLDKVCAHMDKMLTQWTVDSARLEASKYVKRKDFEKNSPGAYGFARRKGILDTLCLHMPRAKGGYNPEKTGYLYVVELIGMIDSYVGFGISNYVNRRLEKHSAVVSRYGFTLSTIKVFVSDGKLVENTERRIKESLNIVNTGIDGFRTEAIQAYDLVNLFSVIESGGLVEIKNFT